MLPAIRPWLEDSRPEIWRWKLVLLAVAMLPCLAYLVYRDPAEPGGLFPPCPFLALTGFHCPGCGTLRALHQAFNGHLLAALSLNPLTMLAIPLVAYVFLPTVVLACWGRRLPVVNVPSSWAWGLLVTVMLLWLLRNLPFFPLTWLAP